MGLIIKQKEIAKGTRVDVYIRIDSVRAGMGEDGKITCSCSEWVGTESRAVGEQGFKSNVPYHIPDEGITITNGSLIQAVYPAFKKFFESQGYEVVDDLSNYGQELAAQAENELQKLMAEQAAGDVENEES